jgi:hypothetical protein
MYDGAEYVLRYNSMNRGDVGNHGPDSSSYSQPSVEYYRNNIHNTGANKPSVMDPARGGINIMFDNVATGPYSIGTNVRIYRSEATKADNLYTGDGVTTVFAHSLTGTSGGQVGVTETVIATGVRTRKIYTTHYTATTTQVTAVTAPPATVTWQFHRGPMGKPGFPCDFETDWDGNLGTVGQSNLGYPCFQQVGWFFPAPVGCTNEATCGVANGANAEYDPAYVWGNTDDGVLWDIGSGGYPAGYVHVNSATSPSKIDIYTDKSASCTPGGACTVGVGVGTTLPTTCTTGVGFWKSDEGSWNVSGNGDGSGVLYKCTATDTWTLFYTPYTYPHPLQSSSDSPAVVSSPVVIARVIRWMEIAAFVTGMGWHLRKPLMAVSLAAIAGCGTLYQLAPR